MRYKALPLALSTIALSFVGLAPAASVGEYQFISPEDVGGSSYLHNGSVVRVDPDMGVIIYVEPKASIAGLVKPGAVLFRGQVGYGGAVSGTAFAFKKGCPPAAYSVTGSFARDNGSFVVKGLGPVRDGCHVAAHSHSSPHSTLTFKSMMSP